VGAVVIDALAAPDLHIGDVAPRRSLADALGYEHDLASPALDSLALDSPAPVRAGALGPV
jgi:hypothetical protein